MSYRSSVDSTGCRLSADLEFLVSTNLKPARKPKQAKPRFWIFWMRMYGSMINRRPHGGDLASGEATKWTVVKVLTVILRWRRKASDRERGVGWLGYLETKDPFGPARTCKRL